MASYGAWGVENDEKQTQTEKATKAIFRARDSVPDLQNIALIWDPRTNFMSMKFGIYTYSDTSYSMQCESVRKISLFSIFRTGTRSQTSNI